MSALLGELPTKRKYEVALPALQLKMTVEDVNIDPGCGLNICAAPGLGVGVGVGDTVGVAVGVGVVLGVTVGVGAGVGVGVLPGMARANATDIVHAETLESVTARKEVNELKLESPKMTRPSR